MIKPVRFFWRMLRNALCFIPITRSLLFPQDRLAASFGRGDADYSWSVFLRHFNRLQKLGFVSTNRILEIGPGMNLGTALLWWGYCSAIQGFQIKIVCWDVFKNASPEADKYWIRLARELLDAEQKWKFGEQNVEINQIKDKLRLVAEGRINPKIDYHVESLTKFEAFAQAEELQFDLIYSQASIEHVWHINRFWEVMARITAADGWHSHRIDLADHGRRESNYIEMLEWSRLGYWLTMRYVPGAINRWRACDHIEKIRKVGIKILNCQREMREILPISAEKIAPEFRDLSSEELRTTAIDLIGMYEDTK
jgi:SAM-dependent methyltransferase